MQDSKLSQETLNAYNRLKQEYSQFFKIYTDLDEEKKEHGYF